MINITHDCQAFSHDIYELVRAFFHGETVEVRIAEQSFEDVGRDAFYVLIEAFDDGEEKELVWSERLEFQGISSYNDRKDAKNMVKRKLYCTLSKRTGRKLPWGTLTGIRPVKLVSGRMAEGFSEEEIYRELRDTYLMSDKKAGLSLEIAGEEQRILQPQDYRNGYSLYIGIPFCPTTCLYCSFTSYPIGVWEKRMDEYLDALIQELEFIGSYGKDMRLNTIYMGGGTPTTLEPKQLDRLLGAVERFFPVEDVCELTVEAGRPDSVTKEKLKVLKAHNVSRISINPQTMNQKTLDLIGRRHTVEQIRDTFRMARGLGFDNINMDLIIGLPGEGYEDVAHTMEEIEKLDPDSITVHSLAIKRAARLNLFKDRYEEYGMNNTPEIMGLTEVAARRMGMLPYYLYRQKNMAGNFENTGYAKVDKAGIYNILIMEEKQTILSAGAGASTKFHIPEENRIERVENVKDVEQYISRIDEMIERKKRCFALNEE